MLIKLKSKNGQHVLKNLNEKTTISELKLQISKLLNIPPNLINIKTGFPPKQLDASDNDYLTKSGISSGDTIIIEELKEPNVNSAAAVVAPDDAAAVPINTIEEDEKLAKLLQEKENAAAITDTGLSGSSGNETNGEYLGVLLKKVVPADNSCLFTSIGFVLNGKIDTECGVFMRSIITSQVSGDKETYTDAFLGKTNSEYCDWISKADSWGGAIEVSILSSFYGIEIDVVDIMNAIINRFGEDKQFGLRVFLLFDGIHYDPLYMESATGDLPKTIFPVEEIEVYQQAEQLAQEAKSSRQFTNVEKFALRCIQCDVIMVGQQEAQLHAKQTGHTNFGEI